jgi:hypothetical protein
MTAGRKTGGRRKGTPNRKTIERQRIAEMLAAGASPDLIEGAAGKLGKEILSYWANEFDRLARFHKRRRPALSRQYAESACAIAGRLAHFQSPTYRAVLMQAPPPPERDFRFTLRIFDPVHGVDETVVDLGAGPPGQLPALSNGDDQ